MIDWQGRLTPYPDEQAEKYRSLGLWGTASVSTEFHRTAERFPDRQAVISDEGALTYNKFDELTDRLALGLNASGIEQGGRVIIQITNRLHTVDGVAGSDDRAGRVRT